MQEPDHLCENDPPHQGPGGRGGGGVLWAIYLVTKGGGGYDPPDLPLICWVPTCILPKVLYLVNVVPDSSMLVFLSVGRHSW